MRCMTMSSPFASVRPESSRATLRGPDGRAIRVLVVDDEQTLSELVSLALRYEGWDVRTAADGASAVAAARDFRPDLVVLDVMLPDIDGLSVLRRMRADMDRTPVLFLTARDALEDRIAGLTAGGDDYVTKPFSIEELVLRLRALLRRSHLALTTDSSTIVVGDLMLDEDAREVRRGDDLISLTATEFELLRFLMRNPKRVMSSNPPPDGPHGADGAAVLDRDRDDPAAGHVTQPIAIAAPPAARRRRTWWRPHTPLTLRNKLVVSIMTLIVLVCAVVGVT